MERAQKISRDNDCVEQALFAYIDLSACHSESNYETSFNISTKGLELAKKIGHLFAMSWFESQLARAYVGLGDMEKATAMAEESLALDRKMGNRSHLPRSIVTRGWIYQIMGEWDKSKQFYDEALTVSQDLDDYQGTIYSCWHIGLLHLDKGEYTKAAECFAKSTEISEEHETPIGYTKYRLWLVKSYIELKEIEKAKKLLEDLCKHAHGSSEKWFKLKIDTSRAMLFRAEKKWDESVDQFERSLKEQEAQNARRWDIYRFGDFLYEYAKVYLERDEKGDKEKAHNLLNQALELFQKLGAKKDLEKIIAKKKLLTA